MVYFIILAFIPHERGSDTLNFAFHISPHIHHLHVLSCISPLMHNVQSLFVRPTLSPKHNTINCKSDSREKNLNLEASVKNKIDDCDVRWGGAGIEDKFNVKRRISVGRNKGEKGFCKRNGQCGRMWLMAHGQLRHGVKSAEKRWVERKTKRTGSSTRNQGSDGMLGDMDQEEKLTGRECRKDDRALFVVVRVESKKVRGRVFF